MTLIESYTIEDSRLVRSVTAGRFRGVSTIPVGSEPLEKKLSASNFWWKSFLRGVQPDSNTEKLIRLVDLFSGSGGFSLGVQEAVRAAGAKPRSLACIDMDGDALNVYKRNFRPDYAFHENVASIIDYHVFGRAAGSRWAYPPEIIEPAFAKLAGKVDVVIAGPPCQGHSNLNNHTRRADPRNQLYLAAAAAGTALQARAIIIENVPDVLSDASNVVDTARVVLEGSGYCVSEAILSAVDLGGSQTRRRHFLVATHKRHVPLTEVAEILSKESMTLADAIGDLLERASDGLMDQTSELSVENRARIDHLFDNDLYDLPDFVRPNCHKNGHSYPAVYGRLTWNKPSQTITTGFMTPGRGRYIHPSCRRVLTPREAARIQGFPDWFDFVGDGLPPSRSSLAKWIGDAVPSCLGYAAGLCALTGM